jgi:hypothetical protein
MNYRVLATMLTVIEMNSTFARPSNAPPVNSNVDHVIHVFAILKCSPAEAFRNFTDSTLLASWLADRADVDPRIDLSTS